MANSIWLKNLTCFQIKEFPKGATADFLSEKMQAQRYTAIGSLEREAHGFTNAFGGESLVRAVGDVFWLQVKSVHKLLPGSVVKRALEERVAQIEEREARKVGKKEKKLLKEEVIDEMMPTAHTTESLTTAVIDPIAGHILVGAGSAKKAERVVGMLIKCLSELQTAMMLFEESVVTKMSDLLLSEDEYAATAFTADSALVLKGTGSPAATVRFAKHNLTVPEVKAHLTAGLRPTSMEMTWDDKITFTLTEAFVLKKLAFLDLVQEEVGTAEGEDEILTATLTIQTGALRKLMAALTEWLGGDEAE